MRGEEGGRVGARESEGNKEKDMEGVSEEGRGKRGKGGKIGVRRMRGKERERKEREGVLKRVQ